MSVNAKDSHQKGKWVKFGQFIVQVIVATLVTFIVASTLHTQSVLSRLISIGADIPVSVRIETIFIDFMGLLPSYGLIILVGMLIAMPIAGLILKLIVKAFPVKKEAANEQGSQLITNAPRRATICLFALAGAVAMFTILAAMHPIMNVTIIAGARGLSGLLTQSIAGAIGGIAYAVVRSRFSIDR